MKIRMFKLMISQSSGSESLTFKVVPDQTWSGDFFSLSLGNVCRDILTIGTMIFGDVIKSGIKCGVSANMPFSFAHSTESDFHVNKFLY